MYIGRIFVIQNRWFLRQFLGDFFIYYLDEIQTQSRVHRANQSINQICCHSYLKLRAVTTRCQDSRFCSNPAAILHPFCCNSNTRQYNVSLDMKGCICHFTKWQYIFSYPRRGGGGSLITGRIVYTLLIDRYFIDTIKSDYWLIGASPVIYPRPVKEWLSLSHNEIGQSTPSFSCYLNHWEEYRSWVDYLSYILAEMHNCIMNFW